MIKRITFNNYYGNPVYRFLFRWLDRKKIEVILTELSSLNADEKILDLGAADGRFAAALAMKFSNIICIDKDQSFSQKKIYQGDKVNFICADLEEGLKQFPDMSVGAIIAVDIMEHIEDANKLFQDIYRVLKKEGKFIIFTPPYDILQSCVALKLHHIITRRRADHISPFTQESLEYKLSRYFYKYKIKIINMGLTMVGVAQK